MKTPVVAASIYSTLMTAILPLHSFAINFEKQQQISKIFKQMKSPIEEIKHADMDPRLHTVGMLPQKMPFSYFDSEHLEEATKLYETLYAAKDFDDLISLAKQARNIVNEVLLAYSFSVAISHRDDCEDVIVPPIQEVFPDRFIPSETINIAFKEAANPPNRHIVVPIQKTGEILNPEYKLAYFHEDIEINVRDWNWHVVYPTTWKEDSMKKAKDRKVELFHMYHQICARYDSERLSNHLPRIIASQNFQEVKSDSPLLSSINILPFGVNASSFESEEVRKADLQDSIIWRENMSDAVPLGYTMASNGTEIALNKEYGANILGDIIESNGEFYAALCNFSRMLSAKCYNPNGGFIRSSSGVTSDSFATLRDPIFYRWNKFIDNIFQEHIDTLPAYKREQLDFPGIQVTNVTVNGREPGKIHTEMKEAELELSHGIIFPSNHSVKVQYKHLDHEPFSYKIEYINNSEKINAVVLIFLGPKYDEFGNSFSLEDQRKLFIELDKFQVKLKPGKGTINRNSIESSIIANEPYTFQQLIDDVGINENAIKASFCGWPKHLLVPRGSPTGTEFELFVMLTEGEKDTFEGEVNSEVFALNYCAVKNPDRKPTGFPFDRPLDNGFLRENRTPNINSTHLVIQFDG